MFEIFYRIIKWHARLGHVGVYLLTSLKAQHPPNFCAAEDARSVSLDSERFERMPRQVAPTFSEVRFDIRREINRERHRNTHFLLCRTSAGSSGEWLMASDESTAPTLPRTRPSP